MRVTLNRFSSSVKSCPVYSLSSYLLLLFIVNEQLIRCHTTPRSAKHLQSNCLDCLKSSSPPPNHRVPKSATLQNDQADLLLPYGWLTSTRARDRYSSVAAEDHNEIDHRHFPLPVVQPHEHVANNKSIYSSLTKIIYQLKNQLERQEQLSKRLGEHQESSVRENNRTNLRFGSVAGRESEGAAIASIVTTQKPSPSPTSTTTKNQTIKPNFEVNKNITTITVNVEGQPLTSEVGQHRQAAVIEHEISEAEQYTTPATSALEKRVPEAEDRYQRREQQKQQQATPPESKKPAKTSGTRQPRRSTITPKQSRRASQTFAPRLTKPPLTATVKPTARSSSSSSSSLSSYDANDDSDSDSPLDDNDHLRAMNALDDDPGGSLFSYHQNNLAPNNPLADTDIQYRTQHDHLNNWSSPMHAGGFVATTGTIGNTQNNLQQDQDSRGLMLASSGGGGTDLDFQPPAYRRYGQKALQLAEASPMRVGEYFGSGNDLSDQAQHLPQQPADDVDETAHKASSRLPKLNPQGIHLERIYPHHASVNSILANQKQSALPPPIMTPQRTGQLVSSSSSSSSRDLNNQPTSASYSSQQQQQQQQQQQRDLMNQPQTIQITAVPNNGLAVGNGLLGGGVNQLLRINTGVQPFANGLWNNNNGLWNNGLLDPLGRPVMMVNAERRQVDWSFWIWPIILVATLPIVLGALFVPVFLKTIVILIQILQSLGLLLPLASALSQQVAHASGVTADMGALTAGSSQLLAHAQKEAPTTLT